MTIWAPRAATLRHRVSEPADTVEVAKPATTDRLGIWALAAANGISQTGNSMTGLAIPWFVLVTTDSASRTGVAGAVVALSPISAGLFSGPIVDRVGYRRTSIISDLLSGVTVALIPLLYLLDWLTFGQLLLLIFFGAFFDVPGRAARRALVPSLARRAKMPLERVNSLLQLSQGVSDAVIAPLLGGVLIAVFGATQVLFFDAGSFAISIVIIGLLVAVSPASLPDATTVTEEEPASESRLAGLFTGFRFVIRDRVMQTVLPIAILFNFLGSAYGGVLLPVYVRDEYNNPAYFGLIISAMGIGMLTGIILFGIFGSRVSRYNIFLIGFSLSAAAIWLFSVPVFLPTDMLGMFLFGVGIGPSNPLLQTLVQIRTPEKMLGRVISALITLTSIAAPLGVLTAGLAVDTFGQRTTMISTAALLTIVPLWVGLSPWSRRAAPAFEE
jgi:MFS family permease